MKLLKTLPLLSASAALAACTHPPAGGAVHSPAAQMQKTHTVTSRYGFDDTVSRLETTLKEKGLHVFAVIDHQAAARRQNLEMQPAKVIIFGNPKAGTPLMVKDPQFALQLPLRVLVTQTGGGVQIVFNDTRALIDGSRIRFADVEDSLAKTEGLLRKTVTE